MSTSKPKTLSVIVSLPGDLHKQYEELDSQLLALSEIANVILVCKHDRGLPLGADHFEIQNNLECALRQPGLKEQDQIYIICDSPPALSSVQPYQYVPSLSLIYGALAGEDIVLVELLYPDPFGKSAVEVLRQSSLAAVLNYCNTGLPRMAYICAGTRNRLESLGVKINELGGVDVTEQCSLYLKQDLTSESELFQFVISKFHNNWILAIPAHKLTNIHALPEAGNLLKLGT